MNIEQILSYVRQKGVVLIADGDQIKYKAPSGIMMPDLTEKIRQHKQAILGILTESGEFKPGDCDRCQASGYWDLMGPGKWCFHAAYYLGKSGHPELCETAKYRCPLTKAGAYSE